MWPAIRMRICLFAPKAYIKYGTVINGITLRPTKHSHMPERKFPPVRPPDRAAQNRQSRTVCSVISPSVPINISQRVQDFRSIPICCAALRKCVGLPANTMIYSVYLIIIIRAMGNVSSRDKTRTLTMAFPQATDGVSMRVNAAAHTIVVEQSQRTRARFPLPNNYG